MKTKKKKTQQQQQHQIGKLDFVLSVSFIFCLQFQQTAALQSSSGSMLLRKFTTLGRRKQHRQLENDYSKKTQKNKMKSNARMRKYLTMLLLQRLVALQMTAWQHQQQSTRPTTSFTMVDGGGGGIQHDWQRQMARVSIADDDARCCCGIQHHNTFLW